MSKWLRVLAVPGRLLPNPETIGAAQLSMVGCDPYMDGETRRDPFTGQPAEMTKFRPSVEPVRVLDPYPGWYFYRAIMDGDLAYVESLDGEQASKDPSLVAATERNADARNALAAWLATQAQPIPRPPGRP